MAQAGIEYYSDIPVNTPVYLDKPKISYPKTKSGKRSKRPQIVAAQRYEIRALLRHPILKWHTITLRPNERGMLRAQFARCRVWTIHGTQCRQEWFLIRRDSQRRITYVLATLLWISLWSEWCGASRAVTLSVTNRMLKASWAEFQAIKYRAWKHQWAFTILASWFVAETRLDWMARFERDPVLLEQYKVDVLPMLSVSNVRELLRAAMPLPQLSTQEATALVIEHLDNRTRSRKSRLRRQRQRVPEI